MEDPRTVGNVTGGKTTLEEEDLATGGRPPKLMNPFPRVNGVS